MSICDRLKTFLDDNLVKYVVISHSPAFTAHEIAATAHVKGKQLVKCVMVNGDGTHYMVAATANQRIDLEKVRKALGLKDARLAKESDFAPLFEDCEVGAMPPFGNLYGISVVVDSEVYKDETIAFNGGNHTSVVEMAFEDFEKLVKPIRASVGSVPRAA